MVRKSLNKKQKEELYKREKLAEYYRNKNGNQ